MLGLAFVVSNGDRRCKGNGRPVLMLESPLHGSEKENAAIEASSSGSGLGVQPHTSTPSTNSDGRGQSGREEELGPHRGRVTGIGTGTHGEEDGYNGDGDGGGLDPLAELRADPPCPVRVLIILQYCLLFVYCYSPGTSSTPQSVGPLCLLLSQSSRYQ